MIVRVRLFAVARQLAGCDVVAVSLAEQGTVGSLRRAIAEQYPQLAPVLRAASFAVDTSYAIDATVLSPELEVACIPPVSGG